MLRDPALWEDVRNVQKRHTDYGMKGTNRIWITVLNKDEKITQRGDIESSIFVICSGFYSLLRVCCSSFMTQDGGGLSKQKGRATQHSRCLPFMQVDNVT